MDQTAREKELMDQLAKRNKELHEFGKKLENEGHICVLYLETYPVQISWCKQKVCKNNSKFFTSSRCTEQNRT